ncbi:MAG: hypothetical protein JSW61_09310 [Candidatus Thorarchaeota archaeon]|nr:MAG: hypothetical protein JSW61_09310 [Candidatus Thorarchaeota archaeon]
MGEDLNLNRDHVLLISISTLPLVLGSAVAYAIADSTLVGNIVTNLPSFTPQQIIIQSIVSTILGAGVVFSLFWLMRRRGKKTKKFVVALVVSPILFFVSIFMGQAFLLILFKGATNPFQGLVLVFSLAVSLLSIALVVIDALPHMIRNIFVAFYGSVFGIFMGVTIVTSSMIVLVVTLIVEDHFLTKYSPVPETATLSGKIGKDPFDYTRIQSESVAVGVGDYVAFSLIAAHAFIFFPTYVWLMSVLLAFVGVVINITVLAEEEKILPAIPLPGLLALFPWAVHISTLVLMVG